MKKWLSVAMAIVFMAGGVLACTQPSPAATQVAPVTAPPVQSATAPSKPADTIPSKPAVTASAKPSVAAATPGTSGGAPSFAGKTIELVAGTGVGGGTDTTARAVAIFLPRYIPGNPKIVVRNQPGAGGVVAMNSFYAKAKPDGLTLLHGSSSVIAYQQRGWETVRFDFLKVPAIGNIGASGGILAVRKGGAKRLLDPSGPPLVMGVREATETTNTIPLYGKEFLGWNLRWLPGFGGTGEIQLAFRRGEIDMFHDQGPNVKMTVAEGLAEPLAQIGIYKDGKFTRRSDFADVPTFDELLGNKKPTGVPWQGYMAAILPQMVYKFTIAPPGTPDNIVKTFTDAYTKMAADREFADLLDKSFGEVYSISVGKDTEKLMRESLDVSPEAVGYVDSLLKKFGVLK